MNRLTAGSRDPTILYLYATCSQHVRINPTICGTPAHTRRAKIARSRENMAMAIYQSSHRPPLKSKTRASCSSQAFARFSFLEPLYSHVHSFYLLMYISISFSPLSMYHIHGKKGERSRAVGKSVWKNGHEFSNPLLL